MPPHLKFHTKSQENMTKWPFEQILAPGLIIGILRYTDDPSIEPSSNHSRTC